MRVQTVVLIVAVLVLGVLASAATGGNRGNADAGRDASGFIVVLERGDPHDVAADHRRDHGAEVRHVYTTALRGYAAQMSEQAAERVARDRRVAYVEADTVEQIVQSAPTGVDRIDADLNPTVTTDGSETTVTHAIAVLDTGIDPNHPDLNVAGGVNFANGPRGNWQDGNGHGTHVAGTIGALDDGVGVVGVAPGVNLWSVRVCGNSGRCYASDIAAGIDWVAKQKNGNGPDFAAANFSISSQDSSNECTSPANATHQAICNLVDTGVPFVMAAGNDNREKNPYPVAFSVSAVADFDGAAGGAGAPTCRTDTDDTLANFSNHGANVDIAAPGVCIESTWPDGGYNTISGTSMAAPHVTGSVALYLHATGTGPATDRDSADEIKNAIIAAAHPQGTDTEVCSYDDDNNTGGPLLFVNAATFGGGGTCGVAGETAPAPDGPTADFSYSCTELECAFTDGSLNATSRQWDFDSDGNVDSQVTNPTHTYASDGTYTVTLTVEDDAGTQDSATQDVAVTASAGDPTATSVSVKPIAYSTQGPWHLRVTATVVDEGGVPVGGASVALTIDGGGSNERSATGTTGDDGTVTIQFNHALRDAPCYTTTVDSVTGDGLSWDETQPSDSGNC